MPYSLSVFPYFVKKPMDTRVRSGVSVQISCSAKGSPVPSIKVSWKKGSTFPAVDEKRFWISTSEGGYKFGISNVKIHDSGEYICSASSRVGTINSSMILTVIGTWFAVLFLTLLCWSFPFESTMLPILHQ